jgi:transcriptional regulator with XRE-family HTH domain
MTLGERISERLQVLGMSQAELARRVGIRQSTINSLINGPSRTSRSLVKIARELETTPAYLIGDSDDPSLDLVEPTLSSRDREILDLFDSIANKDQLTILSLMRSLALYEASELSRANQ